MTPKEKAKELIGKFLDIEMPKDCNYSNIYTFEAKQCVLIALDEMIIQNGELYLNGLDGDYYKEKNSFLFAVKQEIERL